MKIQNVRTMFIKRDRGSKNDYLIKNKKIVINHVKLNIIEKIRKRLLNVSFKEKVRLKNIG